MVPIVLVVISLYRIIDENYISERLTNQGIDGIHKIFELSDLITKMQKLRGLAQLSISEENKLSNKKIHDQWQLLQDALQKDKTPFPEEFHELGFVIRDGFNPDSYNNAPDSLFTLHTMLIASVREVVLMTALSSRVFVESDAVMYNLKQMYIERYPEIGESTGRMRALVSRILFSKEKTSEDLLQFGAVLGNIGSGMERIKEIQSYSRVDAPVLQSVFSCFNDKVQPKLVSIINLSKSFLLDDNKENKAYRFFNIATGIMDEIALCHVNLYGELHASLEERVSEIRFRRHFIFGISSLAMLVTFGFITDFFRKNRLVMSELIKSRKKIMSTLEIVEKHRDNLAYEKDIVESTLERINATGLFVSEGVQTLSLPMERIAGDFLFSAIRPNGHRHYMLGDFTGHGLPSALGSPMVADIFYTMTQKDCDPQSILAEINRKLYLKLPRQLYLAAVMLAFDPGERRLAIWNCGIPEVLHFRGEHLIHSLLSNQCPLGILPNLELDAIMQSVRIEETDRVYAFSDGFIEVQDLNGTMFGMDNLKHLLAWHLREGHPLGVIMDKIKAYQSGTQSDDLTLMELMFRPLLKV